MNIIDAMLSGKPFKRKNWEVYWTSVNGQNSLTLREDDIMANDWELYQEKLQISLEELNLAINKTLIAMDHLVGLTHYESLVAKKTLQTLKTIILNDHDISVKPDRESFSEEANLGYPKDE